MENGENSMYWQSDKRRNATESQREKGHIGHYTQKEIQLDRADIEQKVYAAHVIEGKMEGLKGM